MGPVVLRPAHVAANARQLQAIYGQALMLDGRFDESSEVVTWLFADSAADPVTRTLAACTLVAGGALAGRAGECSRIMRDALPAAEAARTEVPFGLGTLLVAGSIAIAGAGRLDEAEAIGRKLYDRALIEDDEWSRPRGASALGVTALMRGQVRTATRYFRITVASPRRAWVSKRWGRSSSLPKPATPRPVLTGTPTPDGLRRPPSSARSICTRVAKLPPSRGRPVSKPSNP